MARDRFDRPPWWAVAVIVVGLIALVIAVPIGMRRGQLTPEQIRQARAQDAAAAASQSAAAAASEAARPRNVAFLGDSYTGGSDMDSGEAARWPALTSAHFGWRPQMFGAGGTGYINVGNSAPFIERVPAIIARGPDVVVIAGGFNDADKYSAQAIGDAAKLVFQKLHAGLPKADLVVVGPFHRNGNPPPETLAARDAIKAAAAGIAGTKWIDPLPWFADGAVQIGSDGTHPTDAGHKVIADGMVRALTALGYKPSQAAR